MSSEDINMLSKRIDKLSEMLDHKADQLWVRVNLNSEGINDTKIVLQRIDTTLAHLTDSLNRLDNHLAPSNGDSFDKRLDRLEQTEIGRARHIKAIWTAITTAAVGWLWSKLGL